MKDESKVEGTIKQIISFEPSTLETIDYSVHDFVDKDLNIFCTTNKGFKKVPVIWQAAERAFQVKDDKELRDDNGTLIFPMISISRTGFEKSLTDKGVFYGNVFPVNDAKGGSITIARKVTNGINYLVFKRDGHSYEAFVQSDFASTNNITELNEETRVYETNITIKVLGYLIGDNKNEKQPNVVVRENAVDIKTPRERVVLGDEPEWAKGKYIP
jgi:hypothetical protein